MKNNKVVNKKGYRLTFNLMYDYWLGNIFKKNFRKDLKVIRNLNDDEIEKVVTWVTAHKNDRRHDTRIIDKDLKEGKINIKVRNTLVVLMHIEGLNTY